MVPFVSTIIPTSICIASFANGGTTPFFLHDSLSNKSLGRSAKC
ncbi:hypothetical protein Vi05172_g6956 [Venturia inaequalis]|nr:hypothetical protein Vi05172_g6956 [Venturia inaequalis]